MSNADTASATSQGSSRPRAPVFLSQFDFEDGNIIISASGRFSKERWQKKKTVTLYFRVHKSILRLHSTTYEQRAIPYAILESSYCRISRFADLFTVPQPDPTSGGDQQTIDGVAVVHLHDDLSDLVKLMTVMYYGECVLF